ncbi:MAG: hypothetical protein K9H49_01975 [Bacteroidales bacterium]|nr:hypothetical protein [Bacteroidales bacterium]MCF8403336.1 hypothetical protein [Bacteroidales bacterium]
MKENTRRKILGNWLYSIYRRMRYIRYLKKLKKERLQQYKLEELKENQSFQTNIKEKKISDQKNDRLKRKQIKLELKKEKEEIKRKIKEQSRLDRQLEKQKKKSEREETRKMKKEMQQSMRQQAREERKLAREKTKKLREDQKLEQLEIKKRLKEKALQDRQELIEQRLRRDEELKKYKTKKRLLRPYLIRRRLREIFRGIGSINKLTFKRWKIWLNETRKNPAERINFFKIIINSTSLFVLSYLSLYIVGQLITLLVAATFKFDTILFYYKIFYNIDSAEWSGDAVKVLYSIKPFAGLLIGVISLIIFSSKRNDSGVFKLYFLWNFVNGIVLFFGSILLGTLLNQGFGWVIAYLYYKDTGKMIFSIISVFALVVGGVSVSKSFLISGNAYFTNISAQSKKIVALGQVIFPSIIGTAIIAFLKIPGEYYFTTTEEVTYEVLRLSAILIFILATIISFPSYSEIFFDEEPRKIRLGWIYILITVVIFACYYYFLASGLPINVSQE